MSIYCFQWQHLIGSICMHPIWGAPKGILSTSVELITPILITPVDYLLWLIHCYLGPSVMVKGRGLDLCHIALIDINLGNKQSAWITLSERWVDVQLSPEIWWEHQAIDFCHNHRKLLRMRPGRENYSPSLGKSATFRWGYHLVVQSLSS